MKKKNRMKGEDYLYMGNYFLMNEDDFEMMEYYYKLGGKAGNGECYFKLAIFYEEVEEYKKMEICYKKAAKRGIRGALNNLGKFYQSIGEFSESIKCFKKEIKDGDTSSMFSLGKLFGDLGKYGKMKKYLFMAGEKGSPEALRQLGLYYHEVEEDYEKGQFYLSWAITTNIFKNNSEGDKSIKPSRNDILSSSSDSYMEVSFEIDSEDFDDFYFNTESDMESECDCIYCQFSA